MPVPEHLRAELCGEQPTAGLHTQGNGGNFQIGDVVQAGDRKNFGKVVAVLSDGRVSVFFKSPQTGKEKTKTFPADQLTKMEPKPSAAADPPTMPEIITAKALQGMIFSDPIWILPDLIPEGTTLLCGKPKTGKSFLALNVGLALSCGGYALGKIQVARHGVLYLSLEDRQRRLQQRIAETFGPSPWPDSFFMAIEWPSIAHGCIDRLKEFLEKNPAVKLVIVDVLQKVRGRCAAKDVYAADYEVATALKGFADAKGISLIIVHHLRKTPGVDGDILDEVSGSTGLTGAVDTILVLKKDKGKGLLYLRGRDITERELQLERVDGGGWTLLGPADECRITEARKEIMDAITCSSDKPLTFKDLQRVTGKDKANLWRILNRMIQDDLILCLKKFYFLRQPRQQSQQSQPGQLKEMDDSVDFPYFQKTTENSHTQSQSVDLVVLVDSVDSTSQKNSELSLSQKNGNIEIICADCHHYRFNEKSNLPGECTGDPWDDSPTQVPRILHECGDFEAKDSK